MDSVDQQHERLLQDVPTQQLIEHLARRCEQLTIAWSPLIDTENIYTYAVGDPRENELLARTLVYAAVDATLP